MPNSINNPQIATAQRQRYHKKMGLRRVVHVNPALLGDLAGNIVVSTSLSKSSFEALEAVCVRDGTSRSEIIRGAVHREIAFRKYCEANKVQDISALCGYQPSGKPRTKVERKLAKAAQPKLSLVQRRYLEDLLKSA